MDPDLAEALAESMLQEDAANKEREQKKKKEEEEAKRKAKEEEERKKREEEEKRQAKLAAELAAAQGLKVPQKPAKYTKLKVLIGQDKLFEDIECSRFVYQILRERLKP